MRISDWSSDVCSSDLRGEQPPAPPPDGVTHCSSHHQIGDERLTDIQISEAVLALDRRIGIGPHRLAETRLLALFGIEIFDRLEIQQGVDSMGKSRGIEIDHVTAKLSTPFRDQDRNTAVQGKRMSVR